MKASLIAQVLLACAPVHGAPIAAPGNNALLAPTNAPSCHERKATDPSANDITKEKESVLQDVCSTGTSPAGTNQRLRKTVRSGRK